MDADEKIPIIIYATKVRDGITKRQHVWRKDIDDPAPVRGELPDGDFGCHFFIESEEHAKLYATRFQRFVKLIWLAEVPNE